MWYDHYEVLCVTEARDRLGCRLPVSHPEGYPYSFQYIDNESDAEVTAFPLHCKVDIKADSRSDADCTGEDGKSSWA